MYHSTISLATMPKRSSSMIMGVVIVVVLIAGLVIFNLTNSKFPEKFEGPKDFKFSGKMPSKVNKEDTYQIRNGDIFNKSSGKEVTSTGGWFIVKNDLIRNPNKYPIIKL